MPDETKTGQDAQGGTAANAQQSNAAGGSQGNGEQQWTLESAMAEIKKLRDENAERRVAQKKQEEANAAAEQARLEEQGKYKELAEAREKELNAVKPYQERATTLEKLISESNTRRIAQIPEQLRTLVPQGSAEQVAAYLDMNWALLTRKPAPDTDAGAGQGGSVAALTEDEKQMAQRAGMTEDEWRKAKAKAGQK